MDGEPVLRFVQGSMIDAPPPSFVDDSTIKSPDIPAIECFHLPQTGGASREVTTHAPLVCRFARGREAPLGTYMNQQTGSIITCTGTTDNFLCKLNPTYELTDFAPGGFVVSLSDRGAAIQTVNVARSATSIPLFIKD